jgi:Family of unknown function (DUF6499)
MCVFVDRWKKLLPIIEDRPDASRDARSGTSTTSADQKYRDTIVEYKLGTRMSKFDWRSAKGYDRARDAEISGFAWECLRRNPNYQRDHHGISKTSTGSAQFRQRWGLCFRS